MRVYIAFCGIGLGHAFRAMQVGKELKKRGHKVLYSTYEPTYSKLRQRGIDVLGTSAEVSQYQNRSSLDLFKTIAHTSLNLTKTPLFIKEHADIIGKFKPDVIIADTFFSALIAGKALGIPVMFITNQTDVSSFFPQKRYFALRAFTDAIYKEFIKMGEKYLIPDLPLPNAICRYNIKFFGLEEKFAFVGPIVQKKPGDVSAIKFKRQTILVTLGGSGLKADIKKYMEDSPGIDFLVLNSPFEKREGNVTYKKYVKDFFPYLKGCDALLTHGGHTSIMEAVVFGKPVFGISLKGYAERERNLKGIEKSGNGCTVRSMKKALKNLSKYKNKAKLLQKLALKSDGAKKIADMAEEFE